MHDTDDETEVGGVSGAVAADSARCVALSQKVAAELGIQLQEGLRRRRS